MRTIQYYLLVPLLLILSLIGCRAITDSESQVASFEPLEPRSERQAFCGVETFNSRAHELCGIDRFHARRTASCGIDRYNKRASLDCPGARAEVAYNISTEGVCRRLGPGDFGCTDAPPLPRCRAGFELRNESSTRGVDGTTASRSGRCVQPEIKPSCRLEQFGIERYKNCRHRSHGVESYKTCARSEFGVKRYKQCSYYLNETEVEGYVRSALNMIDFMAKDLVTHLGNFYFMVSDEVGLGCTIKRLEADPLYEDVTAELTQYFAARFGDYDASALACEESVATVDINTYSCPEDDSGSICNTVRQYKLTKTWFTSKKQDVANLRSDHAARSAGRIQRMLDQLKTDLEKKDQ